MSDASVDFEHRRLTALTRCGIMDTQPDPMFDELTRLGAALLEVPICAISFIDETRQWFKSIVGMDATEVPREISLCSAAILHPESVLVVEDASEHPTTRENPLVVGPPHVRFYTGVPIVGSDGEAIGAMCFVDRVARPRLTDEKIEAVRILANQVARLIEMRQAVREETRRARDLQQDVESACDREEALIAMLNSQEDGVALLDRDGAIHWMNSRGVQYVVASGARFGPSLRWPSVWRNDPSAAEEALATASAGVACGHTATVPGLDGRRMDFEVLLTPMDCDRGPRGRTLAIFRDVTEKTLHDHRNDRLTAEHDALVESFPGLLARWDHEGRLTSHNRAFREFFGTSRQDLVSATLAEALGEAAARQVEQAVSDRQVAIEAELRDRHGELRLVRFTLARNASTAGFTMIGEDVTEVHAERRRHAHAEAVSKTGSWEYDVNTGIVVWSDELVRLLGCAPTRDLARALALFDEPGRTRLAEALERCVIDGEPYSTLVVGKVEGVRRTFRAIGQAIEGGLVVGTLRDVTADRSEIVAYRRALGVFEASADPMVVTNLAGEIVSSNRAARELFDPHIGASLPRAFSTSDGEIDAEAILTELETYDSWAGRVNFPRAEGGAALVDVSAYAIEAKGCPEAAGYAWVLRDRSSVEKIELEYWSENFGLVQSNLQLARQVENIQEQATALDAQKATLVELNQRLQRMADSDPLTGVYNRRFLSNLMRREVPRLRADTRRASILLFDIDHFKQINDERGHAYGDEVIRSVAMIAASELAFGQSLARWGGEEFLAYLPGVDAHEASELGDRIRAAVEDRAARDAIVTISVGVATAHEPLESIEAFIDAADRAMYASKRAGRNRTTSAA